MLKRVLYGIAGIVLALACAFFVWVSTYVFSTEVMPSIRKGSLNVETNSMILNILWEGNEIYILLTGYTLLAVGFAYGAIRVFRKAFGQLRSAGNVV